MLSLVIFAVTLILYETVILSYLLFLKKMNAHAKHYFLHAVLFFERAIAYSRFVSSAKCLVVEKGMHLCGSLMYIRNSNGPKTDPCGTPCATGIVLEFVLPIDTHCCLLER